MTTLFASVVLMVGFTNCASVSARCQGLSNVAGALPPFRVFPTVPFGSSIRKFWSFGLFFQIITISTGEFLSR
ncbi:hypothetical protein GGS20DRAFT_552967 [Poronia punctata]|nr:hypothetical protein GGS20DRAFT_552967 [Poronia punctata]